MSQIIKEEVQRHIPPLYSTIDDDPWVHMRISSDSGRWVFYLTEYDAEKDIAGGSFMTEHEKTMVYAKLSASLDQAPDAVVDPNWRLRRLSDCWFDDDV